MHSTATRRSFFYIAGGVTAFAASLRSLHAVSTEAAATIILLKNVCIVGGMDIDVLRDYERSILVIIKDGKLYKNTLAN
jgi:hypothetical protein